MSVGGGVGRGMGRETRQPKSESDFVKADDEIDISTSRDILRFVLVCSRWEWGGCHRMEQTCNPDRQGCTLSLMIRTHETELVAADVHAHRVGIVEPFRSVTKSWHTTTDLNLNKRERDGGGGRLGAYLSGLEGNLRVAHVE